MKSLVAARDLAAGTVLAADMLVAKRSRTGLSPGHLDDVVGRTLGADLAADEPLAWDRLAP